MKQSQAKEVEEFRPGWERRHLRSAVPRQARSPGKAAVDG